MESIGYIIMGRKKKTQIKSKQENKRKKRRATLFKKGRNPDEYFSSGVYVQRPLR